MCKVIQAAVAASSLMLVGLWDFEVMDIKKYEKLSPRLIQTLYCNQAWKSGWFVSKNELGSTHILVNKMTITLFPCTANSTTFVMFWAVDSI